MFSVTCSYPFFISCSIKKVFIMWLQIAYSILNSFHLFPLTWFTWLKSHDRYFSYCYGYMKNLRLILKARANLSYNNVSRCLCKQVAQRATIAHLSPVCQRSNLIKFEKHVNGPWKPEARNRNRPNFYACPGYQQL